ncbi:MAG TPA: VTT domain-containing protein [Chloroflexota bacterium]|nr:VTT domain-containing protein [Chloroflexota bacterium]
MQANGISAATSETVHVLQASWSARFATRGARLQAMAWALAVAGMSAAIIALPVDYHALGRYGYLGVFLVTLLSTASLILPVPYIAAIVFAGTFLDPRAVALVAGVAAALGELTGYALGYSGRRLVPENRWYAAIQRWMGRFGGPVIFLAAIVPNPFFDAVGMVAGATRMPLWIFLVSTFLGKTLRFWLLAALGGVFFAGWG